MSAFVPKNNRKLSIVEYYTNYTSDSYAYNITINMKLYNLERVAGYPLRTPLHAHQCRRRHDIEKKHCTICKVGLTNGSQTWEHFLVFAIPRSLRFAQWSSLRTYLRRHLCHLFALCSGCQGSKFCGTTVPDFCTLLPFRQE